jgi:hypothetical protein
VLEELAVVAVAWGLLLLVVALEVLLFRLEPSPLFRGAFYISPQP